MTTTIIRLVLCTVYPNAISIHTLFVTATYTYIFVIDTKRENICLHMMIFVTLTRNRCWSRSYRSFAYCRTVDFHLQIRIEKCFIFQFPSYPAKGPHPNYPRRSHTHTRPQVHTYTYVCLNITLQRKVTDSSRQDVKCVIVWERSRAEQTAGERAFLHSLLQFLITFLEKSFLRVLLAQPDIHSLIVLRKYDYLQLFIFILIFLLPTFPPKFSREDAFFVSDIPIVCSIVSKNKRKPLLHQNKKVLM